MRASRGIVSPLLLALLALTTGAWGQTFSNPTQILIPASGSAGIASPYPSTVSVSGLTGPVGEVTVTLHGITHTFASDLAMLLVGPRGQSVVLMSNSGGGSDFVNDQIMFADGGPVVPEASVRSGVFAPSWRGSPQFPAPAPASGYQSTLAAFVGTDGNGVWSLYVVDEVAVDVGRISGGWSLTIGSTTFTYQGKLLADGAPVSGSADLRFSLLSDPAGAPISTAQLNNTTVREGVFTAEVPLLSTHLDGTPRWFSVAVRTPAGSGTFTELAGPSPVLATPMAFAARVAAEARHADFAGIAKQAESADFATRSLFSEQADRAGSALQLDAPDGSPTGAVVVDAAGRVGVGTPSPRALLHIQSGSSGASPNGFTNVLMEGSANSYLSLLAPAASERGVQFASPAAADHGGVYYKDSVGLDIRTGGDQSRMTINSLGNVGIGVGVSGGSIDARLHVQNTGRLAKFDRFGSDGELVAFARDDSVMGNITVANGVVSYNAFTGSHWAWMTAPAERGALVTLTGENRRAGKGAEVVYGAAISSRANDPACLGAYLAPAESTADGLGSDVHQVMAVGNGEVWVVDTGADLRPGDALISSDTPGCAMLDDPARFVQGFVVAKAAERVEWSSIPPGADGVRRARVSVLFGAFTRTAPARSADLEREVRDLKAENLELRRRLERLERAGHRP